MIPSAGTPISGKDLFNSIFGRGDFEETFRGLLGGKHIFAVNSATTAFYVILSALERMSKRKEILFPAYTAPSLTLPIIKAGLKYRLVDISLDSFNMDLDKAAEAVSDDTLAVLCVNMFGLPVDIVRLNSKLETGNSKPFLIEDAASSFGTKKGGKLSGTFGDIGFISFNRGKNLSAFSGGVVVTDNEKFARHIREEINRLPQPSLGKKMKIYLGVSALSLAVRPWFYTVFRPLLSGFKHTALHESFESFGFTGFQASLGCSLLNKAEVIFSDRDEKGRLLHAALKHLIGVRVPVMSEGWRIAFNQFPILVEDPIKRMAVVKAIIRAGVEATILYDRPINGIYGCTSGGEYPNAQYMADRLVLIPVHHYMTRESLLGCVDAVERTIRQ